MSEAGGLKIANAFRRAAAAGLPVVSLHSSGGCRMQEGMKALVQMQRIAAANQVLAAAGVPHVAILMGPTTGGAWASIAAGADVILAVPEATAAFAGHRVREGGAKATIQDTVASGQVDLVVPREELALTLATLLGLLVPGRDDLPPADVPTALGESDLPSDGWDAVQRARASHRSRAEAYLDEYFDVRVGLAGDRAGGNDPGMLCGFGRRAGAPIAYAAQTGGANTPAGFRTAARIVRLADRLGIPVLTLIDTPGAANDDAAEGAAIGPAIADAFAAIAAARVPVTSLVIGEGGSGGALALASHTELWIAPDGYFAVIGPESAAAILKLPPDEVPAVAERMRLRPQDLVALGVVQGIAPRLT
jgi:acetyl-CoA carboxylase alpha subunit